MEENPLSESFPDAIDSFNAELPKEVPCLLTDIIVVKDTIIVVDNENKKVKRFTRDKQIQDYVCLEDPCGVAKLELSSHLVVTEPLQRQITFINIEDKMTISSYRFVNVIRNTSIDCIYISDVGWEGGAVLS